MIKVLQLHYSFFLSGYPYDAAAQSAAYQQYVNSQVRTSQSAIYLFKLALGGHTTDAQRRTLVAKFKFPEIPSRFQRTPSCRRRTTRW